jgi:uncharacterized membrane protein YkvA (DUF1232 family)
MPLPTLRHIAREAFVHLHALALLMRDPRTPRAARWLAWGVLAYALSPIDLIPDVIPVLGLLDDLVLLPLGIALVIRLTPPAQWAACLSAARQRGDRLPRSRLGALLVVLAWAVLAAGLGWVVWRGLGD